jgi:hypothetical protein
MVLVKSVREDTIEDIISICARNSSFVTKILLTITKYDLYLPYIYNAYGVIIKKIDGKNSQAHERKTDKQIVTRS